MWNDGLDEAQAEIKIAGRNINNLRYADDTTLRAESKEELKTLFFFLFFFPFNSWRLITLQYCSGFCHTLNKDPLDESGREEWKTGLKLNIQKIKIMASKPITSMANSWGNNRSSDRLYFGGVPKSLRMVTAAIKLKDACFLEEKLWPT